MYNTLVKTEADQRTINKAIDAIIDELISGINLTEWGSEIEPAVDSGAVDNVVHPDDVPDDVIIEPNLTGQHFVNASGGNMICYGSYMMVFKTKDGEQVPCPTKGIQR